MILVTDAIAFPSVSSLENKTSPVLASIKYALFKSSLSSISVLILALGVSLTFDKQPIEIDAVVTKINIAEIIELTMLITCSFFGIDNYTNCAGKI
jgi:hypothetical protein